MYNVRPTDRVGIVGIGGLGHLAIQFAAKLGCEVVVFSSTESKREEALGFGAKEFHVTSRVKHFKDIKKINHLLITTSEQPNFDLYLPLSSPIVRSQLTFVRYIPIMAASGTIYPLTVSFDASPIPLFKLVVQGLAIQGTAIAPWNGIKKMLDFVELHNIKPTIMTWPMTQDGVESALKTLKEGKMRYRGVLIA